MLEITVEGAQLWDEATEQFVNTPRVTLQLEHSLSSLSKWESLYHKPFLGPSEKTQEEDLGYIRAMTLNSEPVDDLTYRLLTPAQLQIISDYINDPMTATWFNDRQNRPSKGVVTAELIYYWMVSLRIPFECENWHLTRLLTLIKVCNIKNAPTKKIGKKDALRQQAALNAERRRQLGTSG